MSIASALAACRSGCLSAEATRRNDIAADWAGARLTTVLEDDYPTNLRFIHNLTPSLLYKGVLDAHLDARSIAVVGHAQHY
ncbi:MAG: hypothetical protein OXG55_14240 [bacterium]|nr:hypothetical protein [bacterium]MCY4104400.1 hypothetical protein [bacterium]